MSQLDKLKARFGDQGLPVFVGEYGATHQSSFEDYRRYYMEYVTRAIVERGMLPVYWDNGGRGSGAENFGLIDRASHDVLHPKLLQAMLDAANGSGKLTDITPPS